MTTTIEKGGPNPLVSATPTAYRTTAAPNRPFQAVMSAGADAVLSGAEAAVTELPGGPVLAASFRSSASTPPHLTPSGSGTTPTAHASPTATGSSGEPKVDQLLTETANQNLYFLQLQESLAAENRQYTALSNVLRARHETVKNAIGNIR